MVTERRTEGRIAALEQARAQIELALSDDADWLAFRRAPAGAGRLLAERALVRDPLYRCWDLLNEAIRSLRTEAAAQQKAETAWQQEMEPGPAAPVDLTRIRGIDRDLARRLAERGITSYGQIAAWGPDDVRDVAAALGLGRQISRQNWIEQAALLDLRRPAGVAEPAPPTEADRHPLATAAGHGVELHHILAHIRNEAALHRDPPATLDEHHNDAPDAAPAAGAALTPQRPPVPEEQDASAGPESGAGSQTAGPPLPEPEEATVMFVIRERYDAGSPDDDGAGRDAPSAAPLSERGPAAGTGDAAHDPSAVQPTEAEVVIVSRPADRRHKSAAAPSRP